MVTSPCIHWTGPINLWGYGFTRTGTGGHTLMAHRLVWERANGPVPDGLQIDHVCHNADVTCPGGLACLHRRCVRLDHLEAVTRQENLRRAAARRQTCRRGHEWTPENTRWRIERRVENWGPAVYRKRDCRACDRDKARAARARRREAKQAA